MTKTWYYTHTSHEKCKYIYFWSYLMQRHPYIKCGLSLQLRSGLIVHVQHFCWIWYIYIYNYIIYIITSYVWAVSCTCNKLTKPSNSHFYFILIKIIQQIKQYSILYIHKLFSNYYTLHFFPSKKYKMCWKRKYLCVCIYEIWFNLNLRTCYIKK